MKTINELQELIQQAVQQKTFPQQPQKLYDPISYIMGLGGKRLRPALVLMACDAFGGDIQQALNAALAIEVFHNFTLMHDDIMDKAPLRRGQATVHEKWDPNVAILSGDVMLVEAYKLLAQVPANLLPQVLQIFNETAAGVCEGQQMDMDLEEQKTAGIQDYLDMIRLKTAVLLGGALKIGASIAGAPQKDVGLLNEFGVQLGIAFQLQDDILDVYGNPDKFGKQVGGDILSNKKTFLLITALEAAQENHLSELQNWLTLKEFNATAKVEAVKAIYSELDVRSHAENAMNQFAANALASLEAIDIPQESKQCLLTFAQQLLHRDF